jgi:hypothetical protein
VVTARRVRPRVPAWLAVLVLLVTACEHPIAVVTPHVEAADVIVRTTGGIEVARTVENRSWQGGPIVLTDGVPQRYVVVFVDFQGREFTLDERRDLDVRMEAENESLVVWEPQTGFGQIIPFGVGTTRVRFLAWHQSHADFITPWISVTIMPPPAVDRSIPSLSLRHEP